MKTWIKLLFCGGISCLYLFNYDSVYLSIIVLLICIYIYIKEYAKYKNQGFVLLGLIIFSLPFSFYPILGGRYFSLFIILQISLIFKLIHINKKKSSLDIIFVLLIVLITLILLVYLYYQSFHNEYNIDEFVKIIIFSLSLLAVLKSVCLSKVQIAYLIRLFIGVSFISGMMVLIQFIGLRFYGVKDLGLQIEYVARIGFAGLFYDFSIMAVYMAGISIILLISFFKKNIIFNSRVDLSLSLYFICISVLTSARSGLPAFLITLCLFFILERNFKALVISLFLAVPLGSIVYYVFSLSERSFNLDDTGRWDNYLNAIDYFWSNPIWGAKILGYHELTGNMRAHNFIVDFLAGYGVIITLLLLVLFTCFIIKGLKLYPILAYLLVAFLIGGLFHSSFINTHYIMIPLYILASYHNKYVFCQTSKIVNI